MPITHFDVLALACIVCTSRPWVFHEEVERHRLHMNQMCSIQNVVVIVQCSKLIVPKSI